MTTSGLTLRTATACALVGLAAVAGGCGSGAERPSVFDLFERCDSDAGPVDAWCGSVEVYEDREARAGRTIDLKVVVLPALSNDARPDPLFILAGGPGVGAADMAEVNQVLFEAIQAERDIVLVDQRGTGESHPLDCDLPEDDPTDIAAAEAAYLEAFRTCAGELDADLRLYTTSIAMDDLDDVRAFLGYDRINLYGGSYGTRAGLVYLRRHPERVRTLVLDGVAPPDMTLPVSAPLDGERALDRFLDDCQADAACRERFPELRRRLTDLLARLDRQPARARIQHPRTGESDEIEISASTVARVMFGAFYSPAATSLLPLIIEHAEHGDYQPMMALALADERLGDLMSQGMFLSVICAEDHPRAVAETGPDGGAKADGLMRDAFALRTAPCEFWPRAEVTDEYYAPIESNVPVLILSGDLDPITPPRWGEHVAASLPNAVHVVVPGTGHGTLGRGCVSRLLRQFLEEGRGAGLDPSCVADLARPPFFLSPTGPVRAGEASDDSR